LLGDAASIFLFKHSLLSIQISTFLMHKLLKNKKMIDIFLFNNLFIFLPNL